jgi:peptide/nickel transport system substrate-binding protein
MRGFFFLSAVALMLIPCLSACGAAAPRLGPPSRGEIPVRGGVWIDDFYEEPNSLIPNAVVGNGLMLMDALYAPLFYGDAQGRLHAGLATDIPTIEYGGISPDLKAWTFHLRPGMHWSDGQPLTAEDVDYTWRLWNNPNFGALFITAVNDIASASVSVDKLQITFHLKQPFAPFLAYWTDGFYGPLPKHHFASMDPAAILKSPENLHPTVVSGPFQISEAVPGDHYALTRNPRYYQASQGLPYLEKLSIRITPNQNTILKDLQVGSIDSAFFLDVSQVESYKQLASYRLFADPNAAGFEALYFNFHNPVLRQHREVRQAMAMAVDQQPLIRVARRGLASQLCTEHPRLYTPGYQADAPCPKFDLASAKKLLDAHGWVLGPDGVRTRDGQRLEFQYSTTAGNLWRQDDELINQQNFAKIGIKVDIRNYPASSFGAILADGKPGIYDIAEFENIVGYDPDDSTLFPCSTAFTFTSYCNPELDKLYQQELATVDPIARQRIFNAIHQIELTDFPMIVEFAVPDIAMSKLVTRNYRPSALGQGEMINVWEWWCNSGHC